MSYPEDVARARDEAHVVVGPVTDDGTQEPSRRVEVARTAGGNAHNAADVTEFMRRAGLDAALIEDPASSKARRRTRMAVTARRGRTPLGLVRD